MNLLMSLEIQISSSLLLKSANKRQSFFKTRVFFGVFFFSEIMLKSFGAAYTRVRLIHESLRYLSPAVKEKHIALKFSRKQGVHVV